MFEELSKDFGTVPRGPSVAHAFRLTNNTQAPVHISGIRVSCGCVIALALRSGLAPGESTAIQVQMDTRRFFGVKNVTVYVQFDRPQGEEVRLWVQANSRDDITVTPDALAFGPVKRGSAPSASVQVTLLGNAQWQLLDVQTESAYVQATLTEVLRKEAEVTYQLTAQLRPDAPAGRWYTDLWLKTNMPSMPRVRVPLTVEVESALSVSPATVILGQVKSGAAAERKVIVRGIRPFRILGVRGTDNLLHVRETSPESKPVHVLAVTLRSGEPGDFSRTLRVQTDLPEGGEIEFQAKGQVVSKE
jgi:hypothetical protein